MSSQHPAEHTTSGAAYPAASSPPATGPQSASGPLRFSASTVAEAPLPALPALPALAVRSETKAVWKARHDKLG
jgi:hypothetical protein